MSRGAVAFRTENSPAGIVDGEWIEEVVEEVEKEEAEWGGGGFETVGVIATSVSGSERDWVCVYVMWFVVDVVKCRCTLVLSEVLMGSE